MQLETISMPPSKAKRKIEAYKRALERKANREYESALKGYQALAKGKRLISLSKTIAAGGWDELGRPRLAVARADKLSVRCVVTGWHVIFEAHDRWARPAKLTALSFSRSAMPERPSVDADQDRFSAVVPMVPPDVLPRANADLSKRVVLWEADWEDIPVDPALLLPIAGDLYAVEAVWDLTELERAVITGRRQ